MPNIESRGVSLRRHRKRSLGHVCPECREPWALRAQHQAGGFVVRCRRCSYERPVAAGATTAALHHGPERTTM